MAASASGPQPADPGASGPGRQPEAAVADPGASGPQRPESIAVRLLSLSGTPVQLDALPLDATVRDLALQVRARLGMPISVQNLVHGASTLTDPSASLAEVFGRAQSAEITVVRRPFTPEERAQLHTQLVRAAAGGQVAQLRELLLEGAQVNFKAEGHGVDTSASLSHWGEPAQEAVAPGAPGLARAEPRDVKEASVGGGSDSESSDESDDPDPIPTRTLPSEKQGGPCGGLTPLLVAIAVGDQELARDLRQLGAEEPDMATKHADLPTAFERLDFVDVVKHLAAGADVNTRMRRGQGIRSTDEGAPLHACAANSRRPGAFEVAQILIRMNADMSAGDSEGDNPMAHARYFNATELFRLFRGHGAQIEGPFFRRFGR